MQAYATTKSYLYLKKVFYGDAIEMDLYIVTNKVIAILPLEKCIAV